MGHEIISTSLGGQSNICCSNILSTGIFSDNTNVLNFLSMIWRTQ